MTKHIYPLLLSTTLFLIVGMVLVSPVSQAATSVPPSAATPTTAPLNSGPSSQNKSGSLIIGSAGGSAKLCLNTSTDTAAFGGGSDGEKAGFYCITSWLSIVGLSPSYIQLNSNLIGYGSYDPTTLSPAQNPANYNLQSGFVNLLTRYDAGQGAQAYGTIVLAPVLNICDMSRSGGGAEGACINTGEACYSNSECGITATAVYGAPSSSGAGQAGLFRGTVLIRNTGSSDDPLYRTTGRVCLGSVEHPVRDNPGGACISSWSELTAIASAPYMRLTSANPPLAQNSQANAGFISGHAAFGGAVVGTPGSIPVSRTCGDGLCNGLETASISSPNYCAIDCVGIGQPSITALADVSSYGSPQEQLIITVGQQLPAGQPAAIVVVRSPGTTPTFRPVNGVTYTSGQVFGSDKVLYAGQHSALATFPLTDTIPLDSSPRPFYTYTVYQGNAYPIYGSPVPVSVKLAVVSVLMSYSNVAEVAGDQADLTCSGSYCHGLYNIGANDWLYISTLQTGYEFVSWSGCDQTVDMKCGLNVTTDRVVTATLRKVSGGRGGL